MAWDKNGTSLICLTNPRRKPDLGWTHIKQTALIVLLVSLGTGGCQTAPYAETVLREADIGLPIRSVRTYGVWTTSEAGHGLQVNVGAETGASKYEPNLDLEKDGAARVCAALAKSDRVLEWPYIDVYYSIMYQHLTAVTHQVTSVVEVIMRRETLLELREQNAPPAEYQKHWRFVQGHKEQAGVKPLLTW